MEKTEVTTTAIIQIAPDLDPKVQGLVDEVQKILTFAELRVIATDDDLTGASKDLAVIKNLTKAIDEKKREYTDPINAHLKAVKETFDLLSKPLAEANTITRNKVTNYQNEQAAKKAEIERINRLRLEAAQAEAKLNGTGEITESVNLIPEVPAPITKVHTEAGSMGTRRLPQFEVTDFKLLPDDYKMVDAAKLGKVIRASSGNITIPGVRVWFESSLTINTK